MRRIKETMVLKYGDLCDTVPLLDCGFVALDVSMRVPPRLRENAACRMTYIYMELAPNNLMLVRRSLRSVHEARSLNIRATWTALSKLV